MNKLPVLERARRAGVQIGQRFGLWTVESFWDGGLHLMAECVCECDRHRDVNVWALTSGKSSGCTHCRGHNKGVRNGTV
jgi:hypothetical protein